MPENGGFLRHGGGGRQGVWDGQEARVVEAESEREAAEKIIGAGLIEGANREASIYVKVWPHLPLVKWYSKPTTLL